MEQHGNLYCDECHLAIQRQAHRTVAQEPTEKYPHGRVAHFHNREPGDCWSRRLEKAKVLQAAMAARKGVIHSLSVN